MKRKMLKPSLLAVAICIALSGCAAKQQKPNAAAALMPGTGEFSHLPYKIMPVGKSVRLAIDRNDPVHEFAETGRSYVEALVLPSLATPYRLALASEVVHQRGDKHPSILFPVVTFLDENKNTITSYDDLPLQFDARVFSRSHMTVVMEIGDELAAARYALIHTDIAKQNYAVSTKNPERLLKSSGFDSMIYAPVSDPRYRIDFGPEGWIKLEARPLIPK